MLKEEEMLDDLITCLEFYENLEDNKSLFHQLYNYVVEKGNVTEILKGIHYFEVDDDGEPDPIGTFAKITLCAYGEFVLEQEETYHEVFTNNVFEALISGINFYAGCEEDNNILIKEGYDDGKSYYYEKIGDKILPFGTYATTLLKKVL